MLHHQEKYKEAEKLYQQNLEASEKVLGLEHPDTLTIVYNFAHLFHDQQQYDKASDLYLRALKGCVKTLGLDHPKTVSCSRHYTSVKRSMEDQGVEVWYSSPDLNLRLYQRVNPSLFRPQYCLLLFPFAKAYLAASNRLKTAWFPLARFAQLNFSVDTLDTWPHRADCPHLGSTWSLISPSWVLALTPFCSRAPSILRFSDQSKSFHRRLSSSISRKSRFSQKIGSLGSEAGIYWSLSFYLFECFSWRWHGYVGIAWPGFFSYVIRTIRWISGDPDRSESWKAKTHTSVQVDSIFSNIVWPASLAGPHCPVYLVPPAKLNTLPRPLRSRSGSIMEVGLDTSTGYHYFLIGKGSRVVARVFL